MAADAGDVSVLAHLHLGEVFDTGDHSVLLQRLTVSHSHERIAEIQENC